MINSKVTSRQYGLNFFRATDLTNSAQTIKTSEGNVFGYNLINDTASIAYVKFYNADAEVGTTTPALTVLVPANGTTFVKPDEYPVREFDTRIEVAAVTGLGDDDSTAPGTALTAEVMYA